jgi:hypothetical protein
MKKKKEYDKDVIKKVSSYNKNQNNILKINEERMTEFSKESTNKKLKELNVILHKNLQEIDNCNRDIALKRINATNHYSYKLIDYYNNISKLEEANKTILKEIKLISSGEKETEYILNTFDLINEYMQIEEKEKELMMAENKDIEQDLYDLNLRKNVIIDDYMRIIDPNYASIRNIDCTITDIYCEECNNYLNISDGYAVCSECGMSVSAIQQAEQLSYKEIQEMDYRPQFTYQKETHLDDWLRRFQAKEHKEIPQEILDKVILEAHKQRIKDLSTLTELQVKKFLKKLELNDYYDNVISIINRINKRPPFILTAEVEAKIKEMFQQIQAPFEKYKDPNRKNMLSYSYLLHHFFLILGLPQFSKYFFLLKSPEKLRQQDQTFKKIVEELAKTDPKTPWKFYPSL